MSEGHTEILVAIQELRGDIKNVSTRQEELKRSLEMLRSDLVGTRKEMHDTHLNIYSKIDELEKETRSLDNKYSNKLLGALGMAFAAIVSFVGSAVLAYFKG